MAQALVRFLSVQHSERDGVEQRLIAGCFGIFPGTATSRASARPCSSPSAELPFYHARNEQAMVHTAVGYARAEEPPVDARLHEQRSGRARPAWSPARRWRRSTGCPVLLLPGDVFATRATGTAAPGARGPDARTTRPSTTASPRVQVLDADQAGRAAAAALMAAMRVLTDPAETGAVTLALPQDVQAEAFDFPDELFEQARLARDGALS